MLQFKFVDIYVVDNFVSYLLFRISYYSTEKLNSDIGFFQVLTCCNFPNFSSIEKCYQDN